MGDVMLAFVLAAAMFITLSITEQPSVEMQLDRYTLTAQFKMQNVSMEDAGKIERILKEWFPEVEILNVVIIPDTTTR